MSNAICLCGTVKLLDGGSCPIHHNAHSAGTYQTIEDYAHTNSVQAKVIVELKDSNRMLLNDRNEQAARIAVLEQDLEDMKEVATIDKVWKRERMQMETELSKSSSRISVLEEALRKIEDDEMHTCIEFEECDCSVYIARDALGRK